MAKKTKKVVKKKIEKAPNLELLNKIKYLHFLIDMSMKQVKGDGSSMDDLFKGQADRLLGQMVELLKQQ